MKKINKLDYVPPRVELMELELEHGIATASMVPGDGNNPNNPEVEDWEKDPFPPLGGDYDL